MAGVAPPHAQGPLDRIVAFPRRRGARNVKKPSAMPIARKQRCLVCNHYGCEPMFITRACDGGEATGDNLLPVCPLHALLPLHCLYAEYPQIHRWLEDHERIDAILELQRVLIRLNRRPAW